MNQTSGKEEDSLADILVVVKEKTKMVEVALHWEKVWWN